MIEFIQNIFTFDPSQPLFFTRLYFWVFFFVVLVGYSIIYNYRAPRNMYLFAISLFFYYKSSGYFFWLLIFSTLVDFILAQAIHKSKAQSLRKLFLWLSILINVLVLSYFKYAYFFTESFNDLFGTQYQVLNYLAILGNKITDGGFNVDKIILPVGISFFTFQTISYTVDVYRRKIRPLKNIIDFGFYVSFFPQLVAGPIVRASEFIPQISKKYSLNNYELGFALFMILNGLIKKVLVGDYLAVNLIDRVFANPGSYSGLENLASLYAYSIQVYCDFSGYTDMAIGIALLMGFQLPINFNSPYKAVSVADFWRRWHMSLSSWLKDYVYFPLGGNRLGLTRTDVNLMLTMLIGGLWHGASWNFVIWGAVNGVGLLIYKHWKRISPYEKSTALFTHFWKIFITFNFITFTRLFFRGESLDKIKRMAEQIIYAFDGRLWFEILNSYSSVFIIMTAAYVLHWLPSSLKNNIRDAYIRLNFFSKVIVTVLIVILVYQSVSADLQPFIYFQF